MIEDFENILEEIKTGNNHPFCHFQEVELPFSAIDINGNSFSIPISLTLVEGLKAIATPAPYGKGLETLIDPAVRDVLQIDGKIVNFDPALVNEIMRSLLGEMNINVDGIGVEARLYKLLIYGPGGHFLQHRDTEKEKGMFGTMIVQLPVEGGYEGGNLIIEHSGEREEAVFERDSDRQAYAVAFYADCEHSLEEVKRGYRVALVFNLVWNNIPENSYKMMIQKDSMQNVIPLLSRMQGYLEEWKESLRKNDSNSVSRHAIPLSHKYTKQNLSFTGLKAGDSELARFLLNLEGLEIFLVLECKHDVGTPDNSYHGYRGRKRSFYDYDEHEGSYSMMEVHDTVYSTEMWIDRYGTSHSFPRSLTIDIESELVIEGDPEELFEDEKPTKQNYTEYTGNEGATLENWYHIALLVIAPKENFYRELLHADCSSAVKYIQSRLDSIEMLSTTVQCDLSEPKVELKFYLELLLESGNNLSEDSSIILALCKALDYAPGIAKLLPCMKSLSDEKAVKSLYSLLLLVDHKTWWDHVSTTVFDSNKDTRPSLLCALVVLLISHESTVTSEELRKLATRLVTSLLTKGNRLLNFATDDLVKFTQILIFLNEEKYFQDFANLLISFGNELNEQAPLHRFLESDRLWNLFYYCLERNQTNKGEPISHISDLKLHFLFQIANNRIQKIMTAPDESNSWRFPEARLDRHPEITEFLRSDLQSKTFYSFNDLKHARNFASKYFGDYQREDNNGKYSATASVSGTNRIPAVTVTKTMLFKGEMKESITKLKTFATKLAERLKLYVMPSSSTELEIIEL